MRTQFSLLLAAALMSATLTGCQAGAAGNKGKMQTYPVGEREAEWIREGQPIPFENESWYPTDNIEVFTDREMILMGEHKNVQFFTDKTDVRPFDRLYTKFSRNQFRIFEKR